MPHYAGILAVGLFRSFLYVSGTHIYHGMPKHRPTLSFTPTGRQYAEAPPITLSYTCAKTVRRNTAHQCLLTPMGRQYVDNFAPSVLLCTSQVLLSFVYLIYSLPIAAWCVYCNSLRSPLYLLRDEVEARGGRGVWDARDMSYVPPICHEGKIVYDIVSWCRWRVCRSTVPPAVTLHAAYI